MFLFIVFDRLCLWIPPWFKYISCSYLSGKLLELLPALEGLNTSHVLIYRNTAEINVRIDRFKYISCSYLSRIFQPRYRAVLLFKYISCSYLS